MDPSILRNWNWTEFCGAKKFQVWTDDFEDLSYCFQILCLQVPVLVLFAIISAYYAGIYNECVIRSSRDQRILNLRLFIVLMIALISVIELIVFVLINPKGLNVIDYGYFVLASFTWLVHFCYVLASKKHLRTNLRGPVALKSLWILFYILIIIRLRSLYLQFERSSEEKYYSIAFLITNLVLQSCYGLLLIPMEDAHSRSLEELDQNSSFTNRYVRFREDLDPYYIGTALEGTSWLSRFSFYWVNKLMLKGSYGQLKTSDDVFDLPTALQSEILYNRLNDVSVIRTDDENIPAHLLVSLHRAFGREFYGVGILKLVADISAFVCPLLLHQLLELIDEPSLPFHYAYMYAGGIFLSTVIGSICDLHFDFLVGKITLRLRGALVTTIYRKILSLHVSIFRRVSLGEIINHVSVDMERISNSCVSVHSVWSIPLRLCVSLYLLYGEVGYASIAGVICSFILIPINKYIATKIGDYSNQMMNEKDSRVEVMSQFIKGMKIIKLHVWEKYFLTKVIGIRDQEIKYLKYRKYLDAVCVYFWATTPVMMTTVTFSVYIFLGGTLKASTIFTSLLLLNMLIVPLNSFTWVLNGVVEAWVSIKRVNRFLKYDEVDFSNMYSRPLKNDEAIVIDHGSFSWTLNENNLQNINLTVKKGQLVGITGSVGSGKSTLLAAILGEVQKMHGSVYVDELRNGIGFVSQTPWIQHCSVRENILFGKPYVQDRYNAVIEACALVDDFNAWPKGDLEIVGDNGSTLSGGQKARLALARAVYQDYNVYLFDDVLSAVDQNVAAHIYKECIVKLLAGKTRVLVTHIVDLIGLFDWLIIMENSTIKKQGSGQSLASSFKSMKLQIDTHDGQKELDSEISIRGKNVGEELENEISASGVVESRIYFKYWKSVGHCLALLIIVSVIAMQLSRISVDWWLSIWVTAHNSGSNSTILYRRLSLFTSSIGNFANDHKQVLTVLLALGAINSVIVIIRSLSFAYGGVRAGIIIHNELLKSITNARLQFFQVSPLGRILNRFSSDVNTVDDAVPFDINILLAQIVGVTSTLLTTIYGIPWICVFIAPLIPCYHYLQNHYRLTSRDLKRIISVTMSPLYSHISETLAGLCTIRSSSKTSRFVKENEEQVDALQRCDLSIIAAKAWLNIRLQIIGVTIIGGVCILAALQRHFHIALSGFVGLAISYSLTLTSSLGAVLGIFVETERKMIALERVVEYIEKPKSETHGENLNVALPFAWPSQGIISFSNVFLQYRKDGPFSLKDVSFQTSAGEKIGILGRTGAGKSSIFASLFRVHDICSGSIYIDTINILDIPIKKLRSKMTIIPQEPFLFAGTVRENLDPLNMVGDFDMWRIINLCGLASFISKIGGLGVELQADGINLSSGEKQLLCVLRAVLCNSKIVCIDEATANLDVETEKQIRNVIKNSFHASTVLIIAHRLESVLDCDRIILMDEGGILRIDSPQSMLQNDESQRSEIFR